MDPTGLSIKEQRNKDVIDVEIFSGIFEPEEDEMHEDCDEP